MPAVVTCSSCGMQYDGSGLAPGAGFACTECGALVSTGARAPVKRAPASAGRASRPPARGAGPSRPTRQPTTQNVPYGGGAPQRPTRQTNGPAGRPGGGRGLPVPQKKSNTGLIVGIVAGVVVLLVVVLAVALGSGGGQPQQDPAQKEDEELARRKREAEQQDREAKEKNDQINAVYDAALMLGPSIAKAMTDSDAEGLSATIDWNLASLHRAELAAQDSGFLCEPLFNAGEWEKGENGRFTGKFKGTAALDPDALKKRVLDYFRDNRFGVQTTFEQERSNSKEGRVSMSIGGKQYIGNKLFVKNAAGDKLIEFWAMGEIGKGTARVVKIVDKASMENLKKVEAPFERSGGEEDNRDFTNPDRREGPPPEEGGDDPAVEEGGEGDDLPAAEKTGDKAEGTLQNIWRDIRDGAVITGAQIKVVHKAKKEERKAFLGACIDLLIDAKAANDRRVAANVTLSLEKVYGNLCTRPADIYRYNIDNDGLGSDVPIRAWYEVYVNYDVD